MKIIIELPMYTSTSGGVRKMIRMAEEFHIRGYDVSIRFQKLFRKIPKSFPLKVYIGTNYKEDDADICITYSDNPYINETVKYYKRVLVYQLSYGMVINQERKVIKNKKTIICTSTQKIKDEIIRDGIKKRIYVVGHSQEECLKNFYPIPNLNRSDIAIMFHRAKLKRFKLANNIANSFCNKNISLFKSIFGSIEQYSQIDIENCNVEKFYNIANIKQLRYLYSSSRVYLNCSSSEGLNMTPIEATLCGCPSVLCDGAIDEIFIDNENCLVTNKDNPKDIEEKVEYALNLDKETTEKFRLNMIEKLNHYTWEKTLNNLIKHF